MPRLLTLTVSVLLLVAPTAHASFAVSPAHVRFPAIAVGPGGNTAVAWERLSAKRFAIEARVGRGPRSLGAVQRFTTGTGSRVAVGEDGTAALLWAERGGTLRAAIARPGHRFGPSQVVDRQSSTHSVVGVVIQPGGRIVAAYIDRTDRLRVALAPRGGKFAAPRRLARVSFSSSSVALDPRDGTVVLTYTTQARAGANSQAAVTTLTPAASAFTPPVQLTNAPTDVSATTAISGPGGAALAIDADVLQLSRRNADGSWSALETFASQPDNSANQFPEFLSEPTAALLADGSAIPIWWLQVNAPDGGGELLRGEIYAAGQLLTPAGGIASPPSVAAAGDDAFIATAIDQGPVELFSRAAGTTSFTSTVLSSKGNGDAQLAASGTHVLAAFQRDDRLNLTVVR